ncbi:hypothetical protein I5U80_13425 [Stenotrophomonas maltophilia]|nr:hypothetical protein [Stenotrophomonas maltophilia]
MIKICLFDKLVLARSAKPVSIALASLSFLTIFFQVQDGLRVWTFALALVLIAGIHVREWEKLQKLTDIKVKVDNTLVTVKVGDIFEQEGLKVIAFNEYFDTVVDDVLIAKNSLNGIFLTQKLGKDKIKALDERIKKHRFLPEDVLGRNDERRLGKKMRYRLGTIYRHEDYVLAAFSKFDDRNKAVLTMPQYLEFMINFWANLHSVYAGKNVSTTIMGSGITHISQHRGIEPHELLKIMLWTYRISETRVAHPAILSVIVAPDLIGRINLAEIEAAPHGL